VVDLDADTVAALEKACILRSTVSPDLVQDTALVLDALDGKYRHLER
jgi:hypothetical protein